MKKLKAHFRNLTNDLFAPSILKRSLFFFLCDVFIIVVSLYSSFLLRFEFAIPAEYGTLWLRALPLFVVVKIAVFTVFRMYRISWRYVGLRDLQNIITALVVSQSLLMVLVLVPMPSFIPVMPFVGFPRSIFLIDGGISALLLSGIRISKRVYLDVAQRAGGAKPGKRTVIVGAGNTGEMILRDMARQGFSDFIPVGLLDDDPLKRGLYIHGLKVLGPTEDIADIVRQNRAEAVIIAIPSLTHQTLRRIYEAAKKAEVGTIKIVPRIYDYHRPDINLKSLEDISVEDLIGRKAVRVDIGEIEAFLRGKVILVTGAGGSIGSEIVHQVLRFGPGKVILFDVDETDLHHMQIRIERRSSGPSDSIVYLAGDIRDEDRLREVFETFRPQIVFHAAAYKHVPMMERNPKEAVKVNMLGTYNLAGQAVNSGVEKFVMISTDKAVRPTSVMGATKRMAEHICNAYNATAETAFISVRFGNVLGSRGSVVPLFLEQLRRGGPLTVTHKDVIRYFMTIPEAVSLVLQASVIGRGGDVLVLDMGEPVRIVDLAEDLIRLHGMEPYRDVDIAFTGLRPGEKLFEEVLTAEEGVTASRHEKIFIAKNIEKYVLEDIERILGELRSVLVQRNTNETVKAVLKKHVRHYEGA